MTWTAAEGTPSPLGVTWLEQEQALNFAVYSQHAESVTLLLYSAADLVKPVFGVRLNYLTNKSGPVWHCRVPIQSLGGVRYYAYSVSGPNPSQAHSFDPQKILLDPYARCVFFPPSFDRSLATREGSNAGKAPLGMIHAHRTVFDWGADPPPRHESDAIVYELHVKGFTQNPNSGVDRRHAGTYAGLVDKIPYLQELGVTVVELMPVYQRDPQEENYWGYMPLNFFSPQNTYSSSPDVSEQHTEFRTMVQALHQAGIEVVLDVVYNHTSEGNQRGPIYSFKGFDSSEYYMMSGDPANPYMDYSGTGNTLACSRSHVRQMVVESLRYWAREMHIDGFRFDLASVFTRNPDGSLNWDDPPIFGQIASEMLLRNLRLIAEPWDAAGAYQLGRTFPGVNWQQWNGRFRDDVRRFVRGDSGMVPGLMQRLYGSDDFFPDDRPNAYHAYQSVNYLTSHDGFTLYDLVAYNQKHNLANGHNNTDGMDDNNSWNCGYEGDDGVPADVLALRRRQVKNFCALLMLSNGTPMFRAGDEFLNSQKGNNNPYNQDNEISWLDWDQCRANQDTFRFFRKMIAFRKSHPSLSRSRFWREDVHWYGIGPTVDLSADSHSVAFFLNGASQSDTDLYVMINAWWEPLVFTIQEGAGWSRVVDTSLASPEDFSDPAVPLTSAAYRVDGRSVVALEKPKAA